MRNINTVKKRQQLERNKFIYKLYFKDKLSGAEIYDILKHHTTYRPITLVRIYEIIRMKKV